MSKYGRLFAHRASCHLSAYEAKPKIQGRRMSLVTAELPIGRRRRAAGIGRVEMWRGDFRCEHIRFPPLSSGGALRVRPWLRFHIHRVTGGGHPPPVPTERGVQIYRTTLFGSCFTAPRVPATPDEGAAVWVAVAGSVL
jgi:hypothetical protein